MSRVILQMGHINAAANKPQGTAGEQEFVKAIAPMIMKFLPPSVHCILTDARMPFGMSANLFLSLHCDGVDNAKANGFSIGYSDHPGSKEFAQILKNWYLKTGLRWKGFNVTKDEQFYYGFERVSDATPACLLEFGFLTNPSDREYLNTQKPQIASLVAHAICDFLQVGTSPQPTTQRRHEQMLFHKVSDKEWRYPWYDCRDRRDHIYTSNASAKTVEAIIKYEGRAIASQKIASEKTWDFVHEGLIGGEVRVIADGSIVVCKEDTR